MNLKNKNKIAAGLMIVLTVLVIYFAVFPIVKSIKGKSLEILSQKEEFLIYESKVSNLESFKDVYNGLEEFLVRVDSLFVSLDVPIGFINFLEDAGKENNVLLKISSGSSKKDGKGWSSLVFQMNATGSFFNLIKFLNNLENSPYLIKIGNLTLSSLERGGVRAVFSIEVSAK